MSFPHVRLRLPTGAVVSVAPGGIVGRAPTSAARIADPRVSEAHALVSLRGRELQLVGLRGRLCVDGEFEDEIALVVGQHVVLAEGVALDVVALELPDRILALELPSEAPRELCAPIYSLLARPELELVPAFAPDAVARIWSTGEDWNIQVGLSAPTLVLPGLSWTVAGQVVWARSLSLQEASAASTQGRARSLTVVARHTTVHLLRDHHAPLVVDGLPGRILSEVALLGSPAHWTVVAREVWPHERDADNLRALWDRTTRRLRLRLREGGVREDLVRLDGRGNVELFKLPGDRVVDEA